MTTTNLMCGWAACDRLAYAEDDEGHAHCEPHLVEHRRLTGWTPRMPCGTRPAYRQHLRHGEKPCAACKTANAANTNSHRTTIRDLADAASHIGVHVHTHDVYRQGDNWAIGCQSCPAWSGWHPHLSGALHLVDGDILAHRISA